MRARRGEAGFTLVELSVVILLSMVIGGILTTAMIVSMRRQSDIDARAQATIDVRQALQRVMREIRGADPLYALSDDQLALGLKTQAGLNRTLTYSLVTDNGDTALVLDEKVGSNPPLPRRTVVDHVVDTAPVFAPTPVPGWQPTAFVDASCRIIGSSSYDPHCVGTVGVHLVVNPVRATGTSPCDGVGATCYIDVSDVADIRNNTS